MSQAPSAPAPIGPGDSSPLKSALAKSILIFAGVFTLYFFTRSSGLDDWDSVGFAMAVGEFDLLKHQPHPPGYPLFVFPGWIGSRLFGWDPVLSLQIVACLGGALLVAIWFIIIRANFSERLGWMVAGALAMLPAMWMTSTKVLSDSLGAGLLSAQLLAVLWYRTSGRLSAVVASALTGAAAAGVRPQLIPVVMVILLGALIQRGAQWRSWFIGFVTLILGCFLWLLPMWFLQAKLLSDRWAYPKLVYQQWSWRFNRPDVYVGASDWSASYFLRRFDDHILGWFTDGFGLVQSPATFLIGVALATFGLVAFGLGKRERAHPLFWKSHRSWIPVHICLIFCFLPESPRYYLVVFPFLLIVILSGWMGMPKPWNLGAFLMPVLLLCVALPLAIENHRIEAAPIQMIRRLQSLHPPAERNKVVLLFTDSQRHAQWYAPNFTTIRMEAPNSVPTDLLENARAVYTEVPSLKLPKGWHRVRIGEYERSPLVHPKHRRAVLFRLERLAPS